MIAPGALAALSLLAAVAARGAEESAAPRRLLGIGSNLSRQGWTADGVVPRSAAPPAIAAPAAAPPVPSPREDRDADLARGAWAYFDARRSPRTGLVNGVDRYPFVTMWDVGSTLAALVCAHQLGVIDGATFERLADQLLATLATLPLYAGELPNREYGVDAAMRDLAGQRSARGSGWSALDVGRLLLWLKILATWYPARAPTVDAIVAGWRFARLAQHQEMNGVLDDGRVAQLRQEGRFGYEQYAASGYRLWGVDVAQAFDATTVQYVELLGERVPYDRRNLAFLTSEPFVLGRMEVGPVSAEFDDAVPVIYAVQRRRAQSRGVPTAVSEDAVDAPPWFVYDNVYYEGEAWRCVGHDGGPAPNRSALSAKAALGWWAIFPDAYSESLHAIVTRRLATPNGILPGIYEATDTPNRSLNVNTSAVVLESLLYRQRGGRAFLAGEPQPRGGG